VAGSTLDIGVLAPADECHPPCVVAEVASGGKPVDRAAVTLATGELVVTGLTGPDGRVELCPLPGALPPGVHEAEVSWDGEAAALELEVRPFGYSLGLDRDVGPPRELLDAPIAVDLPLVPVLTPAEGTWYSYQVTSPFLLGDVLAFAGTDAAEADSERNPYRLGLGRLAGDAVTGVEPLALEGDDGAWDAWSQNAPALIRDGGGYALYYQGRATEEEYTALGRALSADGASWEADPHNPIFRDPGGASTSHPAVLVTGDVMELWYASEGGILYALSGDGGASFEAYCGSPAVHVDALVKAPEVLWLEDRYVMTYTWGEPPAYQIGWAESTDGARWLLLDHAIATPGGADWYDTSVASGQLLGDGRMLFDGVGATANGIGIATVR
jgi:hypothetical protein